MLSDSMYRASLQSEFFDVFVDSAKSSGSTPVCPVHNLKYLQPRPSHFFEIGSYYNLIISHWLAHFNLYFDLSYALDAPAPSIRHS